jgi:hypothetical protein
MMNDALPATAIIALVVNLLSVIHYGSRLRKDVIDQVKADEKRWADHERRLALVEQSFTNAQQNLNAVVASVDARLKQINEPLFGMVASLLEDRARHPTRKL